MEISPLSKCRRDDPSLVERFEIYVAGMEIGNAFSELNDPIEQERRFREQVESGGEEAHRVKWIWIAFAPWRTAHAARRGRRYRD